MILKDPGCFGAFEDGGGRYEGLLLIGCGGGRFDGLCEARVRHFDAEERLA